MIPGQITRNLVNFLLDCQADFTVQTRYAGELDYTRIRFSKLSDANLEALQDLAVDWSIQEWTEKTINPSLSHYIDIY